jgi:biopolymer transport protein ExbD
MFRIRRTAHEPRIELAPMIDVMLFLLTFFIYSVMMMERVDLVPMEMRTYRSGQAATPAPAATISVDLDGRLYLDRRAVSLESIAAELARMRDEAPDLVVYLALADGESTVDRSALLLDVWDRLQPGGFNVNIVGKKRRGAVILDESDRPPVAAPKSPVLPPTPGDTTGPTAPVSPAGVSPVPASVKPAESPGS